MEILHFSKVIEIWGEEIFWINGHIWQGLRLPLHWITLPDNLEYTLN